MMLPIKEPRPAVRRIVIDRPNGQITYDAIRKHAMANGIVMMSTQQTTPAIAYPIASQRPENRSQITLRSVRTGSA